MARRASATAATTSSPSWPSTASAKKDIVANVNFFAYVPVGDKGEMDFRPPLSKPGDHVDLRAEMDVLAVISNCPQINNPAAGFNPSPVRVVVWEPN